jgi:hypothetical protein
LYLKRGSIITHDERSTEVETPPAGLKVTCNSNDSGGPSATCPIVSCGTNNYWGLSHTDNASALTIVGFDTAGTILSSLYLQGTRYLWQITQDAATETIVFWGQNSNTVDITWTDIDCVGLLKYDECVSGQWTDSEQCGASTFPPTTTIDLEDFEGGTFLPDGWTSAYTGVSNIYESTTAHSGTVGVIFNDISAVVQSDLITPQIDSLVANASLKFWEKGYWLSYYEYHGIWISVNGAAPVELMALPVPTASWENREIDLSAYVGESIQLYFRYTGDFADEWFLDDIVVGN